MFSTLFDQATSDTATTVDLSTLIGVRSIAVLFLICAAAVPFLQLIALFVLWAVPMTLPQQKRMFVVNEILASWQYLEVYLIAVVVTCLQVETMSGFMSNGIDVCNQIAPGLAFLSKLGFLHARDATCLLIEAEALPGTFTLLGAAVLLNLTVQVVNRATVASMGDREKRLRGEVLEGDGMLESRRARARCLWLFFCCLRSPPPAPLKKKKKMKKTTKKLKWKVTKKTKNNQSQQNIVSQENEDTPSELGGNQNDGMEHESLEDEYMLPHHWETIRTQEGEEYFWNTVTGETSWVRPMNYENKATDWLCTVSEDGQNYWFNQVSGAVSWTNPNDGDDKQRSSNDELEGRDLESGVDSEAVHISLEAIAEGASEDERNTERYARRSSGLGA